MTKSIEIAKGASAAFHNQVDYCVGTGRMGLALQKEYQDQLALVQEEIGFSFIRGHGLFHEDMSIYQETTDRSGQTFIEYNFTYLDLVMDAYLRLNIRPFLELGFMPKKMASGDQAIFYWQGNTTPPKSYQAWAKLVQATLRHLMERYGEQEVLTWPIEVWNEPNLPGFWKDADMEEYFKLFEVTFKAIKEVDERLRVGGPAICGVRDEFWIRSFLEFCRKQNLAVDFITRHHYTTEMPEPDGHYGYPKLSEPEGGFKNLQSSRDIVDSFPEYAGLEIHITEFNTSYIPNCPLHDTNQNAAYIAHQLSRLGDVNESYSYWTFGDIFEEHGVPFSPFHGGFGLVANGCIPKPTFWSFAFFKQLQGDCVHRGENAVIVKDAKNRYKGVVWNAPMQSDPNADTLDITFTLPTLGSYAADQEYALLEKICDESTCNPRKIWHDLGEPLSLTKEQKKLLQESARPLIKTGRLSSVNEALSLTLQVQKYGVTYFEIAPVCAGGDRGYRYDFAY
ncbi:MAG: xylan 1,4-beta-xylosidase [Clostridium sp.]|jgi:xylan 1,4-beta-xylosidase|nr:xylan 1,4-beta-xylosidase [Clostridium sp.]